MAVAARWFRQSGGMPPSHLCPSATPVSTRSLSFVEREQLALLRVQGVGMRACSDGPRRRSRVNCVAMPRRGVGDWTIGRCRRSGTPSAPRAAPKSRSWSRSRRCARMSKRGWPASFRHRAPDRFAAPASAGPAVVRAVGSTGDGRPPGVPRRLRIGSCSTSRMTHRCASATKRFTRRCMCKAVAPCVVS